MREYLRVTIRFLQPLAHGRTDGNEPEWPPSPLRIFQALVAAAAARWNERQMLEHAVPALNWLQNQPSPEIVACGGIASAVPTQLYVPDNTADLLVASWRRGETDHTPKRTDKVVLPTHLDGEAVHYLFSLHNSDSSHLDVLKSAARSITHVGWGIDMVVADADVISETEAHRLEGAHWRVAQSGGIALRVPKSGTLDDLMRKHQDFLNRLTDEGFKPVPPLREFDVRYYRRSTDPEPRPYCVFTILKPDASGNRAFNTPRRTRDVAAWIRHAVADVCESAGWPDFLPFVHGHRADGVGPNNSENSRHRFQYLPLPTINSELNRVESIRRVMIAAPVGFEDRINFIRRRLLGHSLKWEGKEIGILNIQPGKDWVRDQYTGSSSIWTSVTPVILDGFDDHIAAKTQKLIRKTLANAGITAECDFEWQPFGFRQGVEPVREFKRPEKLTGTMVHLRLHFKQEIRGPFAIGAGRYRGFGLMVVDD
ncbi:MAG: type I-U CRISPR-associated protein Cas5/Cas6 [Planctomycetaceae bacterium]|nr:type I-U CRISPR-associated protein Cas5/Cas6 [Planctomycetaceae bacterium]